MSRTAQSGGVPTNSDQEAKGQGVREVGDVRSREREGRVTGGTCKGPRVGC